MKVVLRADGSPYLGLGHLNRCSLVCSALMALGNQASLAVTDNPTARSFLKGLPVHYLAPGAPLSDWPQAQACLVDLYNHRRGFYDALTLKYEKIGIFDDFEYIVPRGASLVVNPNLGVSVEDYPQEITALTGARYFPLRPEFNQKKKAGSGKNIFVCLGGSDPEDQSPRLAGLLRKISNRPIDLVLGPGYEHDPKDKGLTAIKGLNLHRSIKRPSGLMRQAEFAVSAGGSMLYELAALGIPTACLALSQGQVPCTKEFHRQGAALFLGHFNEVGDQHLAGLLQKMETDASLRLSLGQKATSLMDGRGAERLALALEKWLKGGVK